MTEGSGTRSSLGHEAIKAILALRPKWAVMENVKALLQKKFRPEFAKMQQRLADAGYTNFVKVLNAKHYGVPQNRERVFMVSVLDCEEPYNFPAGFPLTRCLGDVLEENVDERYYLRQEQVERILAHIDRKQLEDCGFRTNFTPPKE